MSAADNEAERHFVDAFFDDLDSKIAFLPRLYDNRRQDEARLLCLLYLDGLTNWLSYPEAGSARNFSLILAEHSGDPQLGLILPHWLLRRLPWKSAPADLEDQLRHLLGNIPDEEAVSQPDLSSLATQHLSASNAAWLDREMWRGSVAHGVYAAIRSPGVHQLNGRHGLSFSTTYRGEPLRRIGFTVLHAALKNLAAHARKVSEESGKWFGIEDDAS